MQRTLISKPLVRVARRWRSKLVAHIVGKARLISHTICDCNEPIELIEVLSTGKDLLRNVKAAGIITLHRMLF